jgi:hypothetical protein
VICADARALRPQFRPDFTLPVTKPKFLELSDDILYADESHVESQPPSALGLDTLLPRLNWIGSMTETAAKPTAEDGRELSTAEIYERNQVRDNTRP